MEFITELANFEKIVVCAVSGFVNGFVVAMLPYCDYVFTSETSTFCLPYSDLGQTTEGGLVLAARCANIAKMLVIFIKFQI